MRKLLLCTIAVVVGITMSEAAQCGVTTRVSVSSSGEQANDIYNITSCISADGRYIVFSSNASNLVSGDTNGYTDIFAHDRYTGQTTRVSVSSSGEQGNNWSNNYSNSISSDGRYIAFYSPASNLVLGDTNGYSDVFFHDRQTGETTRVSISSSGVQGNGNSYAPSLSADGRYVAFHSGASNLVIGDTNQSIDVYVHDRQTGQTTMVSVSSSGEQGNNRSSYPSISSEGRYVAFYSYASNLVTDDTNEYMDVFVHDRELGETTRVSVSSSGVQGNGYSATASVSADGQHVAFASSASNLAPGDKNGYADIFVHDRQTGETTRVSVSSSGLQGNNDSDHPVISADGRYVAFNSDASNLVPGDTNGYPDIIVHDQQTGQTTRVSISSSGDQGNSDNYRGAISNDGRYVSFRSRASNLVPSDTNGYQDVFVHDRYSVSDTKSQPDGPAVLSGNTVTARFDGFFYTEDANRAMGLKISWPGVVIEGDRFRVDGTITTDTNGERVINASNVRKIDTDPLAPLGMPNRSLGGGAHGQQTGIAGAFGLNNIGLFVTTWGRVTGVENVEPPILPTWFKIDDGSGINLKCLLPSGVTAPSLNAHVQVTGVSSCEKIGSDLHRLLRVRKQEDIVAF